MKNLLVVLALSCINCTYAQTKELKNTSKSNQVIRKSNTGKILFQGQKIQGDNQFYFAEGFEGNYQQSKNSSGELRISFTEGKLLLKDQYSFVGTFKEQNMGGYTISGAVQTEDDVLGTGEMITPSQYKIPGKIVNRKSSILFLPNNENEAVISLYDLDQRRSSIKVLDSPAQTTINKQIQDNNEKFLSFNNLSFEGKVEMCRKAEFMLKLQRESAKSNLFLYTKANYTGYEKEKVKQLMQSSINNARSIYSSIENKCFSILKPESITKIKNLNAEFNSIISK